jgi:hypothetical protein
VDRPNQAYGMLRAADSARFVGKSRATVCEFGVATGNGLVNMIELAGLITAETGVTFRVVGLDTGAGLPTVDGYRDHPEIWSVGDFAMTNRDDLVKRIGGRAELIFGDIKDTVAGLTASLDPDAPLGFVSVDVDIYTGSVNALKCLDGPAECYAPAVSMYFDDVRNFFHNRWCGELLAIEEFNRGHEWRKIDVDRSLVGRRPGPITPWYNAMYVGHVLDHTFRSAPRPRDPMSLVDHSRFIKSYF